MVYFQTVMDVTEKEVCQLISGYMTVHKTNLNEFHHKFYHLYEVCWYTKTKMDAYKILPLPDLIYFQ